MKTARFFILAIPALVWFCGQVVARASESVPMVTALVHVHEAVRDGFVHPGIGMTKTILENARTQVMAEREPWLSGYRALARHPYSGKNVTCRNESPTNPGWPDIDAFDCRNVNARLQPDAGRAKHQALMYFFTGDPKYRANALRIIRVWSNMNPAKYRKYPEANIHAAYPIQDLVTAAELLRHTSVTDTGLAWTDEDTARFTDHFARPARDTFLNWNGWFMNQNGYPLAGAMAVDMFLDDRDSYRRRVEWFTVNRSAPNAGWSSSITHLARLVDTDALTGKKVDSPVVQLVEMGRDQAHAGGDVEIFANTARLMNAQGTCVDPVTGEVSDAPDAVGPYEFLNDRILAAADQYCRFMLGYDTPWVPVPYDIGPDGDVRRIYPRIADAYRGRIRGLDFWDMHYHYTCLKAVDVAQVAPYYDEAFSKRIVNSVTDWIFIPPSVTGEGARVPSMEQEPAVVEIEQRSTLFSTNASLRRDGDVSFVRVSPTPEGTRIAILSCDTSRKRIGLRLRTRGVTEAHLSGFAKPWLLPDTQGEWRMTTHEVGRLERFRDLVDVTVTGPSTSQVDLDCLVRDGEATLEPVAFSNGTKDVRIVTYVLAPIHASLAAAVRKDRATQFVSYDLPEGATLSTDGDLRWQPPRVGDFVFHVHSLSGNTIAVRRMRFHVAAGRAAAIAAIVAGRDPEITYVQSTLEAFLAAHDQAVTLSSTATDEAFGRGLGQLQVATCRLCPLTPLLPDGSIDFPPLVESPGIESWIGLLTDGNDDTFPVSKSVERKYVFDFGPGFRIEPSAFAFEGRLNFEDRTLGTVVSGSNDGTTWVPLTLPVVDVPTELLRVGLIPEVTGQRYRFLKFQKTTSKPSPLFEPSEIRIFGTRHEVR